MVELFERIERHGEAVAVQDGKEHTYAMLLERAKSLATKLLGGKKELLEPVAYLCPPGADYVVAQWAIWLAGGIALPLAVSHPLAEWRHVLQDAGASKLILHPFFAKHESALQEIVPCVDMESPPPGILPPLSEDRPALLLYTSGTTNKPKGVVHTFSSLQHQVMSLSEAWGWSGKDHILSVLPLHHIHGVVNVVLCSVWNGATCEFMNFDPEKVWQRFKQPMTLFMAVPTMYHALSTSFDERKDKEEIKKGCAEIRLMVSGSAALPVTLLMRWKEITNHTLLERYGMTEIGMALSNPLEGQRVPGTVGFPLPSVQTCTKDGELLVKGPGVFAEYWGKPEITKDSCDGDWFRTGDVVREQEGRYTILGRQSTDIIKCGGYKVSALEVENALLNHEAIDECSIVGLEDAEWGQCVAAAVVASKSMTLEGLRSWCGSRLAPYKVPSQLLVVPSLPRNAMGKVVKRQVADLFL